MRSFSSSARAARLNPRSARFEDEYTLYCGTVMNAVPELMFTMLPPPCARISGITACIATIGPNTLRLSGGIDARASRSCSMAYYARRPSLAACHRRQSLAAQAEHEESTRWVAHDIAETWL